MVRAGLHWSLRISKQIFPLLFIFGWKTLVLNATCQPATQHFSYAFWDMMKKKNKKEGYLGRFKRVIRRKMNGNLKNTTSIRAIIWTNYGCLPMEHVLSYWPYYYHQNSIHTLRFCSKLNAKFKWIWIRFSFESFVLDFVKVE